MKKLWLLAAFAMLCAVTEAQVPVSPIVQPRVTFVDASGNPCATCTLSTFTAGTTTPMATYTDATGAVQNTNPIVLDASGGASIWLSNGAYKLVLKNTLGTTIWTVDQVKGGGGLGGICGTAGAIQSATSGGGGLTCDPTITINTANHTINVGSLPSAHVTIGAQGTPTSWNFDTSSPATALASLGAAGAVTSVFGRGGPAITSVTGDYTCTQITGAICSATPLQYQTIQAGGTSLPQQPILNLIAGAGMTLNCVNNIGSTRTDCTVAATGDAATICNSNGCYYTKVDGTIVEWGVSSAVPTGADQNVVAVTFPLAFPSTTGLSLVATPDGCVDTCGSSSPKNPVATSMVQGTLSTSGVTFIATGVTPTGGGGGVLTNTIHFHWQAIQKN